MKFIVNFYNHTISILSSSILISSSNKHIIFSSILILPSSYARLPSYPHSPYPHYITYCYNWYSLSILRVVQSKDIVEHIVRVSIWNQVEDLRVSLLVLLIIDQQLTGNHDQNVTIRAGWLGIQSRNTVDNLGEWQRHQLLNDVLTALQLRGLEGQHRLIPVKVTQLGSIGVKLLVVEVAELGGDGVKVNCWLV